MKQGLFKKIALFSAAVAVLHGEDIQDYGITNYGLSKPPRPIKVASLPVMAPSHDAEIAHQAPAPAPVVVNMPMAPRNEASKLTVDVDGNSELGQLVKQIKEELSTASKQREADLEHAKKLIKELEVYKKRAANERAKNVKLTKKVASLNGKLHAAMKEKEAAAHAASSEDAKGQPASAEKGVNRVPTDGGIDLFEECPPSAKKEGAKAEAHEKDGAHEAKSTEKPKAEAHAAAKH
jgi:hypothetical protein